MRGVSLENFAPSSPISGPAPCRTLFLRAMTYEMNWQAVEPNDGPQGGRRTMVLASARRDRLLEGRLLTLRDATAKAWLAHPSISLIDNAPKPCIERER